MDECSRVNASVHEVLSALVARAGIVQGAMNIELIANKSGDIYIIDVGPRNGGNYLPRFFSYISGDDIVEATLRIAVGDPSGLKHFEQSKDGLWVQFMHYAQTSGIFNGFEFTKEYEGAHVETHLYKELGSHVEPLESISDSIGVSLLHFPSESDPGAAPVPELPHVRDFLLCVAPKFIDDLKGVVIQEGAGEVRSCRLGSPNGRTP